MKVQQCRPDPITSLTPSPSQHHWALGNGGVSREFVERIVVQEEDPTTKQKGQACINAFLISLDWPHLREEQGRSCNITPLCPSCCLTVGEARTAPLLGCAQAFVVSSEFDPEDD